MMKAAIVKKFGPPEVIQTTAERPMPSMGKNEALISMKACGINPIDTYIRDAGMGQELPYVTGVEGSGVVHKINMGKSKFHRGDRVWFLWPSTGSCAEFAAVPTTHLFHLPNEVSFVKGATLGIAYFAAYRALFTKANAQKGETVFIHGSSGGVGLAACQLASAKGLQVFGTASTERGAQVAKANGAKAVYNHSERGYVKKVHNEHPHGFDIILEMLANKNLQNDLTLLKEGKGRIVIIGCQGNECKIDPSLIMLSEAQIYGIVINSRISDEDYATTGDQITTLLQAGKIDPVIAEEFSLEKTHEAHRRIEQTLRSGGACGKLVVNLEL